MVSPIDYTIDVLSPMQRFTEGLKFGEDLLTARQGRQETEQLMGMRATAEARAAQEFEMRRAEAARQQAAAEAQQARFVEMRDKLASGQMTTSDFSQWSLENAQTVEEARAAVEAIEKPKLEALTRSGLSLGTSLLKGNIEAAFPLIDERITAAENAGTPEALQEAKALEAIRRSAEIDPQGTGLGLMLDLYAKGLIDEKVLDATLKAAGQGNVTAEGASPLGKIAQDVEAGLIPKSVLDAAIRVDEKASEEGLTLQQKVAEEARLRGEYGKRTEDLSAAERNFSVIQTSAADQSGAGDIALVTSFMKMLDPGSVVRETEFATAANAGGLLATLSALPNKIEKGEFLTPQQRADFQRLAGRYLDAAKAQEGQVQASYQQIVDNYGLDPVNVFGARAATTPAPGATGAVPQSFITNQNVTNAAAAAGVTPEDMWNVMTPEQRARYGG